MSILKRLKCLFGPSEDASSFDALDRDSGEKPVLAEGLGEDSAERLRISFHKRMLFDYTHLVPPFRFDPGTAERFREQIRNAMRIAACERGTAEECIRFFAELLMLCGLREEFTPSSPLMRPLEAVELAEKYYKRITPWQKAIADGAPEEVRINLSKEVYALEHEILKVLDRLRNLYIQASGNGNGAHPRVDDGNNNGKEAGDRLPDSGAIYRLRIQEFRQLKGRNDMEVAYIAYRQKERQPPSARKRTREAREVKIDLESMVQLLQASSLIQGGEKRQLPDAETASKEQPEKKAVARMFKADGDFSVKDKDRLIQIIADCESSDIKFEKDYETLEAMVYCKPHQVIHILAGKVDNPVFYK